MRLDFVLIFLPLISLFFLFPETECTFSIVRNLINATLSSKSAITIGKFSNEDKHYIELLTSRLGDLNLRSDFRFSGAHLLRWLKYTDYNIRRSEQLIRNHVKWRRTNNVDASLDYKAPAYIESCFPYTLTGNSVEGNPIFYIPVGKWEFSKLRTYDDRRNWSKYFLQLMERSIESTRGLAFEGNDIGQVIWILDYGGFTLRNLKYSIGFVLEVLRLLPQYPLLKRNEFLVRVPFLPKIVLRTLIRFFRPFQKDLRQVQVFGRLSLRRMQAALMSFIPNSAIPTSLGGSFKVFV